MDQIMLLTVVLLIVVFLASLWFTSFIAKAFGAKRPGMLWVFLVFLALIVVQVAMGLTPLMQHPFIALLLLIIIASFIYSKILEMNLLSGFLTMLVSSIVSGILTVAVVLIAGISLPGMQGLVMTAQSIEGEVSLERAAVAAEAVCQCETNKKCLTTKSREFGQIMGMLAMSELSPSEEMTLQRYTQRGFECTLKPGSYNAAKAVIKQKPKYEVKPVFNDKEPESTDKVPADKVLTAITQATTDRNNAATSESIKTEAEEKPAPVPAYQTVSTNDVKKHIGKPVRVLRRNGDQMEGKIMSVKAGKLMVEQRRYGGTFSFPVKLKDVSSLEVYF